VIRDDDDIAESHHVAESCALGTAREPARQYGRPKGLMAGGGWRIHNQVREWRGLLEQNFALRNMEHRWQSRDALLLASRLVPVVRLVRSGRVRCDA
jgi:hypothetical protein